MPGTSSPGIEKSSLNSDVSVGKLRKTSENGGYGGEDSVKKLDIQSLSHFHPCISESRLNAVVMLLFSSNMLGGC